jgi:hypothetical protein
MIRGAILGAAIVAAGTTSGMAEIVFVGKIKFTGQPGPTISRCQQNRVNEYANSNFHPAGVGGNENFAGLSWVYPHYAIGHSKSGNFTSTFQVVNTGGVGWGDTYFRPAAQRSEIRILSSVPAVAAITAATQTLTITGQIKRFLNDPGSSGFPCILNFTGTYVKDSYEIDG